jgi:hypothetical protein
MGGEGSREGVAVRKACTAPKNGIGSNAPIRWFVRNF